jgi:NAD(P)H-hydrate epimerase
MEEVGAPDVIVDAIFGTGIDREVSGHAAHAIDRMNDSGVGIVSADIPSGLSADTGEVMGHAVRAALTVTFGLPKAGFFANAGPEHTGCVSVIDIGIPGEAVEACESNLELNSPDGFAEHFSARERDTHKGTYGHVAVFAGSGGHLGAGYLASLAALRAGCGLATYCLPAAAFDKFDARYPEIMCEAIPDEGKGAFAGIGIERALEIENGKQAIAIGPAIGTSDETGKFVNAFLLKSGVPAVIDADALNVLDIDALERTHVPAVLTPHPGEMSRLVGVSTKEIQADRVGFARSLADRTGAVVVLKGSMTVVAEPRGQDYINFTGNAGMATAGTGDALTGMIASFIAQGMEPIVAARAAVYIHGLAGDMAAEDVGQESLVATDVISHVGRAIESLRGGA